MTFEGAKKQYPGYQSEFAKVGSGSTASWKVGSWVIALLPHSNTQALRDRWDDNTNQRYMVFSSRPQELQLGFHLSPG